MSNVVDWQAELNDAVFLYLKALRIITHNGSASKATAYDELKAAESTLSYAWAQFVRHNNGISTPANTSAVRQANKTSFNM